MSDKIQKLFVLIFKAFDSALPYKSSHFFLLLFLVTQMNGKTKTWHISNIEYTYYFKALNRLQNKSLSKIFAPKSVIRGIVFTNNPI